MLRGLLLCANFYLFPVWTIECVGAILAKGCGNLIPVTQNFIPKPRGYGTALNHVHKLTECGDHTYSLQLRCAQPSEGNFGT